MIQKILEAVAARPRLWPILDFIGERDLDHEYFGHGNFKEYRGWWVGNYWVSIDEY